MKRTDADEFTSYVEARMDRWRRTAYLLSRDWHTADDLVSILVSKVFRHWRKISQMDNVDAYAQRMLTRTWLDETRRRAVARRALATFAGVVTISAGLIGGMSLVQARSANDPPTELLPTVTASPVPESADTKASRVSAAWQRATAKVLPGAKWKAGHTTESQGDYYDKTATLDPPALATQTNNHNGNHVPWRTSDRLYYTAALVEVAGVEGKLHFRTCLTSTEVGYYCPRVGECWGGCVTKTGPNGELIKIRRQIEVVPGYELPHVQFSIWIGSADGTTSAEISLDNVLGPDGSPQTATQMPLTEEQIIAILLEPGLMI